MRIVVYTIAMLLLKKIPSYRFTNFRHQNKFVNIDQHGLKTVCSRRKMWEINLKMGKPVTKTMHVCSLHFRETDFITPNKDCYQKRFKKKLQSPLKIYNSQSSILKESRLNRVDNRSKIELINGNLMSKK